MSAPDTAVSTRQDTRLVVRDAVPADYPAIREVVIAAYRQYADLIAPEIFSAYLADLLDLERTPARGDCSSSRRINGSAPSGRGTPTHRSWGSACRPGGPVDAPSPSIRPRVGMVPRAF